MDKPPTTAILRYGSYDHGLAMSGGRPDRIVAAAILYCDELWVGTRHSDIIRAIIDGGRDKGVTRDMQGFLTDTDMFVRRGPAERIARRAGQIKRKMICGELTSEDLW